MTTIDWRSRAKTARDRAEDVVTKVTRMPPRRIRGDISPLWLDFAKTGQDQVGFLTELCGLTAGHRVLDIGCGVGRLAVPLTGVLGTKGRYDGFDVLPYMIDWCTRNISRTHPNFHFQHADVRTSIGHDAGVDAADYAFPYEDDAFDLAYAGSLFTHLTPDGAANYLTQIARVLRPGGVFVSTWNMYNAESERLLPGRSLDKAWPHARGSHRLKEAAHPESNVAFDELWLRPQYRDSGLRIVEPVRPDATYSPLRVPARIEASHLWYTCTIIALKP
ncbi:class I SAM-dependent methyltransferase [Amycolatopsis nigrescens]|uniref:class I SAM-dependent methyltransferase n=1 Tax=Amycolatopsis nigrescens TaxID=381445 RepID=UPI00035D43CB|nr:class I SAM-dependent methyltransferase [Amycolatopsis nigrescens]